MSSSSVQSDAQGSAAVFRIRDDPAQLLLSRLFLTSARLIDLGVFGCCCSRTNLVFRMPRYLDGVSMTW